MEIFFPDAQMRDLYSCRQSLIEEWGTRLANLVCCRLSVLQAARTLSLVPTAPPIGLAGEPGRNASYSVSLGRTHELRFKPDQPQPTSSKSPEVTRISIVGVFETTSHKGRK